MAKAILKANHGSLNLTASFNKEYLVNLRVNSYGFKGAASDHAPSTLFDRFLYDLESLEKHRRGKALLEPVASGFRLIIQAANKLGHMKTTGFVRSYNHSLNAIHVNDFQFSFEFESSALKGFIKDVRKCC